MTIRSSRCFQPSFPRCPVSLEQLGLKKLVNITSSLHRPFQPAKFKLGFNQALSQWRVLSGYLRPTPKNDQTYLSQRDANVTAAATAFNDAFTPWARSAYSDSARRQNVAEIFKSAADVGILIFSQPSSFAYQWHAAKENRSGSSLVVTPAFLKVADENANLLDRPQTMIQMTTQSI
jgi:hypothetical protein